MQVALALVQRLPQVLALAADTDVLICRVDNALVDLVETIHQRLMQRGQRRLDRCGQQRRTDVLQDLVLGCPALIADEVVFEALVLVAVANKDIACLQGIAQLPVDQEFVAINDEPLGPGLTAQGFRVLVQVRSVDLRDEALREILRRNLLWRLALAQHALQEFDGLEQRSVVHPDAEFQLAEQVPQVDFEPARELGVLRPLVGGPVEVDVEQVVGDRGELLSLQQLEGLGLDLGKRGLGAGGRIDEQAQHLARRTEILRGIHLGLPHGVVSRSLGFLLVGRDQVHEGLDQVVVDLPESLMCEAQ